MWCNERRRAIKHAMVDRLAVDGRTLAVRRESIETI
jgi:hypothetical protein